MTQIDLAKRPFGTLTKREREVLDLACQGKGYKQIGRELGMSFRTAEALIFRACMRVGVRSKKQLVEWQKARTTYSVSSIASGGDIA